MVGAAGGVGFWQLIWSPYKKHGQDITHLQKEIAELEAAKLDAELTARIYETKTKKKSLPAHIDLAKREYSRLLTNMLRKAEFDATDLKVTARDPNTTNVPTLAPKKYAYTKLEFDVTAKGDLNSVVDFLYHFYRQPLLHQITKITIVKPSGGRGRGGDLDVTLLVQAIALDKAENRGVLLATLPPVSLLAGSVGSTAFSRRNVDSGFGSPFTSADVLARAGSKETLYQNQNPTAKRQPEDPWLQEYRRIAGKNIFYPPNPIVGKKEKTDEEPKRREPDLAPFLALIQVTHNDDGSALAVIRDRYNKEDYEIEQDPKGGIRVVKFWYSAREEQGIVLEIKKRYTEDENDARYYYDSRSLTFGSKDTGNERAFRVKRILESDIVIEPYVEGRGNLMKYPVTAIFGGTAVLSIPGTLYTWHIGHLLKSEEEGHSPTLLKVAEARYALLRPLNFDGPVPPPPASDDSKKKEFPKKKPPPF
jgi:hypothetical protein